MSENAEEKSMAKAWLVAIIIILSGWAFGMMLKKIAGTMLLLMPAFDIGPAAGGSLVSAISILGLILALPIGSLVAKFGARNIILAAFGFAIAGNVIGAFAGSNYSMLFAGRIVEGAGFGMFLPAAPSLIAYYFPPEKRGLPMGLWSTNVGAGALLVLLLTNAVVNFDDPVTWNRVWWAIAGILLVLAICFFIFVRPPKTESGPGKPKTSIMEGLKSVPTWLMCIAFMFYTFGFIALTTFMPTYLKTVLEIDPASANIYTSVLTFTMIVGGFVCGALLKKIKRENHPKAYLVFIIISALIYLVSFQYGQSLILVFAIFGGLLLQFVPATLFNNAPDTCTSPALVGVAMGIISLCQNIGGIIAGTVSGTIIQTYGWMAITGVFAATGIVSILFAIAYVVSMNKRRLAAEASEA